MEKPLGDRLLNKLIQRAQIWASVSEDESVEDGKAVMRARKNFLSARRETFEYVQGLERTNQEMSEQLEERKLSVQEYVARMSDTALQNLGLRRI